LNAHGDHNSRVWQYLAAVSIYTKKELSHKSDILAAFAGIINKIWPEEGQISTLKHGLPLEVLPKALLWEGKELGQLDRRVIERASAAHHFPTWSWSG
jgi:hypothetical protein